MKRSAPMKRTGFKRKQTDAFKTTFHTQTLMRKAAIKTKKKRATKAEREYMGIVAGLYCIVCRNLHLGESPAEVHHVRFLAGGGQRSGNLDTIPLCPWHHRIGGYGVAYHAGPDEWERRYGTEAALLEQTKAETQKKEAD